MKCEGMMLDDPFLIEGNLKHINTNPTSGLHHFGRVKRDDESQAPSVVNAEISPVAKVIIRHGTPWDGEQLIRRPELSDYLRQCGQAVGNEGNVILGDGMVDAHPLPDQGATDAPVQGEEG